MPKSIEMKDHILLRDALVKLKKEWPSAPIDGLKLAARQNKFPNIKFGDGSRCRRYVRYEDLRKYVEGFLAIIFLIVAFTVNAVEPMVEFPKSSAATNIVIYASGEPAKDDSRFVGVATNKFSGTIFGPLFYENDQPFRMVCRLAQVYGERKTWKWKQEKAPDAKHPKPSWTDYNPDGSPMVDKDPAKRWEYESTKATELKKEVADAKP